MIEENKSANKALQLFNFSAAGALATIVILLILYFDTYEPCRQLSPTTFRVCSGSSPISVLLFNRGLLSCCFALSLIFGCIGVRVRRTHRDNASQATIRITDILVNIFSAIVLIPIALLVWLLIKGRFLTNEHQCHRQQTLWAACLVRAKYLSILEILTGIFLLLSLIGWGVEKRFQDAISLRLQASMNSLWKVSSFLLCFTLLALFGVIMSDAIWWK